VTQKELTEKHQTILVPSSKGKAITLNRLVIGSGTDRIFESSQGFKIPGGNTFRVETDARVSIPIDPELK
jgi:hypothetical protein